MGIFYLADAVTGLTLQGGESVVAVIVKKVQGGYPAPAQAEVMPAIRPHDVYMPVCTPFRATAGDYGPMDIVPESGQPAFDLFLAGLGHEDWTGLAKASLGHDADVPLGVVAVSSATWETLSGIMDGHGWNREEHIEAVIGGMREISAGHGGDWRWKPGTALMTLQGFGVELPSGRILDLPLAHALSSMDFTGRIDRETFDIAYDKRWEAAVSDVDGPDHPWLRNMLGSIWDGLVLAHGLQAVNRIYLPSPSAGQERNDLHVARMAISALTESIEALSDLAADGSETSEADLGQWHEMVEELLVRVEERRTRAWAAR